MNSSRKRKAISDGIWAIMAIANWANMCSFYFASSSSIDEFYSRHRAGGVVGKSYIVFEGCVAERPFGQIFSYRTL